MCDYSECGLVLDLHAAALIAVLAQACAGLVHVDIRTVLLHVQPLCGRGVTYLEHGRDRNLRLGGDSFVTMAHVMTVLDPG